MRPGEPAHHDLVEPAEPGHLHQLRLRHLEDERRDAEADQLGERSPPGSPRASGGVTSSQTSRNFSGSSRMNGTMNTTSVAIGGSRAIVGCEPRLHWCQRNAGDDPRDDRLRDAPQPRLEQEDEREQDQKRASVMRRMVPPVRRQVRIIAAREQSLQSWRHWDGRRRPGLTYGSRAWRPPARLP